MRILACIDVVSFHLQGEHALLGIGLPSSLVIAFALSCREKRVAPIDKFVWPRVKRLMLPFLFWSVLHGALLMISAHRHGEPISSALHPGMIWYGTNEGLWFLPAMLVGSLLAYLIDRATRDVPFSVYAAACCVALGVLLLPQLQVSEALAFPFPQWRFMLTALPAGLLLGRTLASDTKQPVWRWVAVSCLVIGTAITVGETPLVGAAQIAARYAFAFALLTLGAYLPGKADPVSKLLVPLLLGVYAVHFTVHEQLVRRLLPKLLPDTPALVSLVATLVLSFGLVWLLRRTPLRRFT